MVSTLSGPLHVISGVPQGSVLGLLLLYYLFSMWMISAVSLIIPPLSCLHADDVTIFKEISNVDDCCDLQKDQP